MDKYATIFSKQELWNYYDNSYTGPNPFEENSTSDEFINGYFKKGSKESVFDTQFPSELSRNLHSISTFFLGFLIKPLLNIPETGVSFSYLWFISCLYHDYGYYIENQKELYIPKQSDLNSIVDQLDIKYNLLQKKYESEFLSETIEKYYLLCQKEYGFINHGIIGGLLLYDRLRKNYLENKNKAIIDGITGAKDDDFVYKNLHWSNKHNKYYMIVADAILSHNIWFSTKSKTKIIYEKYGLNELIMENTNQRFNFKNPILILLLLCDTIEPIKSFTQFKPPCVLNRLNIEISKKERSIKIFALDSCINYQNWFDKIEDLKTWLKLSIEVDSNTLTIKL